MVLLPDLSQGDGKGTVRVATHHRQAEKRAERMAQTFIQVLKW